MDLTVNEAEPMQLIYVDESGGHDLSRPDPNYPVFVLAAAVFDPSRYVESFVPRVTELKIRHLGHDGHPLHEAEIRKRLGVFGFEGEAGRQAAFMESLAGLVSDFADTVHAQVMLPSGGEAGRADLLAAGGLVSALADLGGRGNVLLLERRGRAEDEAMRRRLHQAAMRLRLDVRVDFCPKSHAVPGLELADLVARPIGLHTIRPWQDNRAFQLLQGKARIALYQ